MSNKNPNTAQSFATYIQQNKNSTKNNNISTKSTAKRFVEFNNKEKEREAEEKIKFETTQNLLNMRIRSLGWQMERNSEQFWSQFPEGTREAALFRASLNPNIGVAEPKRISYDDAKKVFEIYDFNINNPITLKEFENLENTDPRKTLSTYIKPNSPNDYMIFINPEEEGYIKPEGNTSFASKIKYSEELNKKVKKYQNAENNKNNLEELVDNNWNFYLKNLRVTTPKLTNTTGTSDYSLLADINPTRSKSYIEAKNTINKEKSASKREDGIINSLNNFYNFHPDITPHYGISSKVDSIIHTSNVTRQILDSFKRDDDGNIIINGNVFPEYFVYKQIFGEVGNKFGTALQRDSEESAYGLGRLYVDNIFQEKYGMSYDEYLNDVYYKRVKKIRNELETLRDNYLESAKPTLDKMSSSRVTKAINIAVPITTVWTQTPLRENLITQPFDDVIETLDSHLTAIKDNNFLSKFTTGVQEGFDLTNLMSLGFAEPLYDVDKLLILNKVKNKEALDAREKYIYKLIQYEHELNNLYQGLNIEKPIWGEIGSGVGTFVADMPAFALSMYLTGGIGSGVKYGTQYALKKAIKQKTFKSAMNFAKRSAIDFAKFYGVATARGAAAAPITSFTYRSYTDKALQQYSFDENGNLVFSPKSQWAMAIGAYLEGANEIASEHFGAVFGDAISLGSRAFGRATGISKVLNKTGWGAGARRAFQTPMSAATRRTLKNLGYTGILSEPLSEVWGDVMTQSELMVLDNTVNLIKDGKDFEWKKEGRSFDTEYSFENFKSADYWLTIMGVSTISGGGMTALAAGRNVIAEANHAKKIANQRNKILEEIKDENLKNTLQLLGNSDNFIQSAIDLANYDWGSIKNARDKIYAIDFMRHSYLLQSTMGDIDGQTQMGSFESRMQYLYEREFQVENIRSTGSIYTIIDKKGNTYSGIKVEEDSEGHIINWTVMDEQGNVSILSNNEIISVQEEDINEIMISEYQDRFSTENEISRLNTIRQSFESIKNPSEQDVRRITSEFGIRRPEVGKTVKLVDGTEAVIKKDLKNGKYIIERQNSETAEQEEVEIPVYSILSNNPITATAQKKMYEDAKVGYESNNPSAVEEVYKSSEDKLTDIINQDFDTKLFDERGKVKLNSEQIISTFSFEDPTILADYIKKLGNKVSPQIRQSLKDALELSKVYNEAITQVSHAVQTKTAKSDVADLTNTLRSAVSTSSSQISVEELLESIINDPNISTTVKEDFQNILDSINQNNIHKRVTTKTKTETSVTQKDIKNKRDRKQIEKGIKDLKNALKNNNPIGVLNAINWIDETLSKVEEEPITTEEKQLVEETRKSLKEQGYEIQSMRGMPYHEGMKVTAYFILNPDLPIGTQIIKSVIRPQINKDGVIVQSAEIMIEQGPEIEEETPDISQAVTKEMTEEESIDFSEPTDNTVESKKEDSIIQETEEPIVIPELEEFFAVSDSDKLIETPSEEEQIETLTDEQREEVKVHNEQSTNIIDGMPVSTLPDDVNTDDVIVDKHENQGNRIYRYDGDQLRNNQKQVKRVPNKEGDAHDLLYKWLDENNIDLQGIIDNELADITVLNTDIRFMMMTEGIKSGYTTGSPMLNTVFQVVEYTDAIKRIHNEKRGGVITFNGKEYLLVGITGFRTSKEGVFNPEAAHYNFIADKVLKPARNNYVSQTNELNREPYYVHPSMSTKIKTIEAGWLVTQTLKDSEVESRSLGELFKDETRNPHGINTKNSKWLIQTRNSTKPITVRVDNEDIVHSLKVSTGYAGGLFLLVPAANGHYIPVFVKIQTTNELADGTLKDTIWETAQNLLSNEKETRDYAINELCKLLNLTKEGYNIFIDDSEIDFDNPNSAKIIFTHNGTRLPTEIPLSSPDALNDLYKILFSNIPFQLNIGLQTLVSPGELQAYIDAGVLKTDAALLGTTNASYTIHSVGPNLKEDPQQDNARNSQEESYGNSSLQKSQDNRIINYRGKKYYHYTEEQFIDIDAGEFVTNTKEIKEIKNQIWLNENNPTPARIEPHSGERIYIKSANEVISVSKKGIITIYSPEHSISIINEIERLNQEEIRQINAEEALSQVDKLEQEKQEVKQEIQDYKVNSSQEVTFDEDFDMFNNSEQEVSTVEEESSSQEEEYLIPSEEISGTFTEGVVENSDLNQLSTVEYLSTIEEQLKAEGLSEDTVDSIMEKVYNQLTELGLNSYYSKDQESMIKIIIDKIKNCG